MARKIYSSLSFRRNTPGSSVGSVKRLSRFTGHLFTFSYKSFGPNRRRPRRNTDEQPLLLLATKDGEQIWKADNGQRYIWGFNLNYLPARKRAEILRKMSDKINKTPGVTFTFKQMLDIIDLTPGTEKRLFRKYDVRGSKLRYLKQVDLNTYKDYLDRSQRPRT